jgi:hypothetical protein
MTTPEELVANAGFKPGDVVQLNEGIDTQPYRPPLAGSYGVIQEVRTNPDNTDAWYVVCLVDASTVNISLAMVGCIDPPKGLSEEELEAFRKRAEAARREVFGHEMPLPRPE